MISPGDDGDSDCEEREVWQPPPGEGDVPALELLERKFITLLGAWQVAHRPRKRRMHISDIPLLSDSTRRNALIACSVVPDFMAEDLVEALELSPVDADEVVEGLLNLGAIHRAPGSPPPAMDAVDDGVRGVILSTVRAGFAPSARCGSSR